MVKQTCLVCWAAGFAPFINQFAEFVKFCFTVFSNNTISAEDWGIVPPLPFTQRLVLTLNGCTPSCGHGVTRSNPPTRVAYRIKPSSKITVPPSSNHRKFANINTSTGVIHLRKRLQAHCKGRLYNRNLFDPYTVILWTVTKLRKQEFMEIKTDSNPLWFSYSNVLVNNSIL